MNGKKVLTKLIIVFAALNIILFLILLQLIRPINKKGPILMGCFNLSISNLKPTNILFYIKNTPFVYFTIKIC